MIPLGKRPLDFLGWRGGSSAACGYTMNFFPLSSSVRCTGERVVQQCASAKISRNVVAGVYVSVSSGVRFLIHICVCLSFYRWFCFDLKLITCVQKKELFWFWFTIHCHSHCGVRYKSEILECHVTTTNMSESKKKSFFATLVRSSKNSAKSADNSNGDHESKR